jgi:predicted nucleic acid-binding protein
LAAGEVDDVLDYLCSAADQCEIFYLRRPFLKDPKDDMVLELAVEARCRYLVTFNVRDFTGAEQFGIEVVTPKQFLQIIGEIP